MSKLATTDWTTCSICLEVFDNPKSLPCIHGFCLRCLEHVFIDKRPGDKVPCPLCRKGFKIPSDGLEGLQHHFFIQHLVDAKNASSKVTGEVLCQACLEESGGREDATIYCIDCNESLCEKCSRPHRRTTMKGGAHHVRPLGAELEQELIQLRRSSCDKHKDEQVKLYCYDCDENICVLCFAVKHRNHISGEIPDVARTLRSRIEDDDAKILSGINTVRQQSEQTKLNVKMCVGQVDSIEELILEAGEALKSFVDHQISEYLVKLQSFKLETSKQAEIIQEQLQLALVAMESFHTFSTELLDKGRPCDVTRAAVELHKRATELLDNDVTSVQYCPHNVTFTPADVTQLAPSKLIGKLTFSNSGNAPVARASLPNIEITRQDEKKHVQQQHHQHQHQQLQQQPQTSNVIPRRLQEEIRHTPVEKDSASLLEQEMKKRPMGHVLHTLPEGNAVFGVTSMDNRLYVLRDKSSQQIEVFDTQSYRLLQRLTVPRFSAMNDIISCAHNRCLYIADANKDCIHRVGLKIVWMSRPDVRQWSVNDIPAGLSVTDTHSLLVTCDEVRKIKEFSSDGKLLREVELSTEVMSPWHTVQLSSGDFIVCHGRSDDPVHRVCLIGSGGDVAKSYGGPVGSGSQQMNLPAQMAVGKNGFVFVVDHNNYRVLLVSPAFNYVREVVTREQLKWKPQRVWLDNDKRRLYVAVNVRVGEFTAGRIVVIGV